MLVFDTDNIMLPRASTGGGGGDPEKTIARSKQPTADSQKKVKITKTAKKGIANPVKPINGQKIIAPSPTLDLDWGSPDKSGIDSTTTSNTKIV